LIDWMAMLADNLSPDLTRFHEATARIEALIETTPTATDSSREAVQARAVFRAARLKRFLQRLGNPHQGYPIVHVGGTSGKGSTSTAIAAILTSAGFTTGLHTSPYLQTPTEKLQVNGQLISSDMYIGLCDQLMEAHAAWLDEGEEALTYGEAWIALTMLFFRESAVDMAVLEVGAGGRFDLTNIVDPAVAVITSVGIDHTATLGTTIPEIAWHKAGIIKSGIQAVTGVTNPEALQIIRDEAMQVGAPLTVLDPDISATNVTTDRQGTTWTDGITGVTHHTALRGSFQARNGALALAAVQALRDQGFHIPDEAVERGLQSARIPGRVEIIEEQGCLVMLDGAHNAEKVAALAEDVPSLLPIGERGKRIGVLGVLEAKQAQDMVGSIVPVLDVLVVTSPQVTAKEGRSAADMADVVREAGFHGPVHIVPEPDAAIGRALELAGSGGDAVLVTGSLYLVGNVRERWYRTDDVIRARSSWPERRSR
jgi:dihydrofolate synthase/folylpolyglutamate synthase